MSLRLHLPSTQHSALSTTSLATLRAPPDNHRIRALVTARAISQRGLAPRGLRLATDRRLALTTAMWMVARVHHGAAHRGPLPLEPVAPGLADDDVLVIDIADLPERRHAIERDEPHLAGRHAHLRVVVRLGDDLRRDPRRADELPATARLHLQ